MLPIQIPGGPEVFLVPGLLFLAFLGLVGKYLLKWFREGYQEGTNENQRDGSSE